MDTMDMDIMDTMERGRHMAHAPIECEKETKNICKKVPVKEEVSKDIEFCKGTPKKVKFILKLIKNHIFHGY